MRSIRKTIRRRGGTPSKPPSKPPHYNVFSPDSFPLDDTNILNKISDILNERNKTHKFRVKQIKKIMEQRKMLSGRKLFSSSGFSHADVSPTADLE
jgi:hypothetical protein